MENMALREKHTFSTETKALCGCDVELKQSLDDWHVYEYRDEECK